MKVWFNKINDSRRAMLEVADGDIRIGRDPGNTVVLASPLVSREHAVVRFSDGRLELENVGLNSCVVGDTEVYAGQTAVFEPGAKVRIWPYTLTFESETATVVSRSELESHLRSIMADLELRIHKKLLERLGPVRISAQPRGRHRQHRAVGKQHRGRLPRAGRFWSGERIVDRRDQRPDAARSSGQSIDHGNRRRSTVRSGFADAQRVRRAGHAGAGARDRTAWPAQFHPRTTGAGRRARLERPHQSTGRPVRRRVSPGAAAPAPGAAQIPACCAR